MTFKYSLVMLLLSGLSHLPLPVLRGIGRVIGRLMFVVPNRNARIIEINLRNCFPELGEKERQHLLKLRLMTLCSTAIEMALVWAGDSDRVFSLITQVEGDELLDATQAKGRGTIILAPHLGNWEVIGLYLAQRAKAIDLLYSPPKSETMHRFIVSARQRTGARLVPASRTGVIQLLKTLRNGDSAGILPDQVPAEESGIFVPFFGQPALTMTLMAKLAKKTGAAILTAYALPVDGGFKLVFSAPDPEIYSSDVSLSVAAMNRTIEQAVRAHPEHYQWEYKRFKRQPEGSPSVYN